jgi:hypothetical protein
MTNSDGIRQRGNRTRFRMAASRLWNTSSAEPPAPESFLKRPSPMLLSNIMSVFDLNVSPRFRKYFFRACVSIRGDSRAVDFLFHMNDEAELLHSFRTRQLYAVRQRTSLKKLRTESSQQNFFRIDSCLISSEMLQLQKALCACGSLS